MVAVPRPKRILNDADASLLAWHRQQAQRAAVPIHPADDPVIRRGKHHIAEVGQPTGQGETR